VAFRRQALGDVGGYPEGSPAEDLALYLALARRGHWQMDNLAHGAPLVRVHRGGLTRAWTQATRLRIAGSALDAARAFAPSNAWAGVTPADWLAVQRNDAGALGADTRARLARCLDALCAAVVRAHPLDDAKAVQGDCVARQGLLVAVPQT